MSHYPRIFYSIIMFCGIFFMPWWIIMILGVVGIMLFDHYFEIIFCGMIFDALFYQGSGISLFTHTLIFSGVFLGATFLKQRFLVS